MRWSNWLRGNAPDTRGSRAIPAAELAVLLEEARRQEAAPADAVELHLLVRTPEQLDAAIAAHPASITLDYLDLYGLRPSVERVQAAGIEARVASPRVLKPGEERDSRLFARLRLPDSGAFHGTAASAAEHAAPAADRRFQPERGQRDHRRECCSTWDSTGWRRRTI